MKKPSVFMITLYRKNYEAGNILFLPQPDRRGRLNIGNLYIFHAIITF